MYKEALLLAIYLLFERQAGLRTAITVLSSSLDSSLIILAESCFQRTASINDLASTLKCLIIKNVFI